MKLAESALSRSVVCGYFYADQSPSLTDVICNKKARLCVDAEPLKRVAQLSGYATASVDSKRPYYGFDFIGYSSCQIVKPIVLQSSPSVNEGLVLKCMLFWI